jgi:hypothetical protein
MDFEYLRKVSCSNLAYFQQSGLQSAFVELMQQDSAIPLLWFGKLLKAKKYMLIIS